MDDIEQFCASVVKSRTSYGEGWREVCQRVLDLEQQLEVLRPGGRYAWKSKCDDLLAALREIADTSGVHFTGCSCVVCIARRAIAKVDRAQTATPPRAEGQE